MAVRIHDLKEVEDRMRFSLVSALSSTLTLVLVMAIVIVFGLILATRQ